MLEVGWNGSPTKKEIDTKNVKEIDSESRTTFMTTAGHSEKLW